MTVGSFCKGTLLTSQQDHGNAVIVNGIPWYDQNQNPVNAHGAGIIKDGDKYWLFGEYKSDDYLSVDTMIAHAKGMGESPAMFKKNGVGVKNEFSWEYFYFLV